MGQLSQDSELGAQLGCCWLGDFPFHTPGPHSALVGRVACFLRWESAEGELLAGGPPQCVRFTRQPGRGARGFPARRNSRAGSRWALWWPGGGRCAVLRSVSDLLPAPSAHLPAIAGPGGCGDAAGPRRLLPKAGARRFFSTFQAIATLGPGWPRLHFGTWEAGVGEVNTFMEKPWPWRFAERARSSWVAGNSVYPAGKAGGSARNVHTLRTGKVRSPTLGSCLYFGEKEL